MAPKFNSDPSSVADTAKQTIPQLLSHSRDYIHLDQLLKQRLQGIPAQAYRVACLQQTELSLFCSDAIWVSRLRLLQADILQVCRQLHAERLISQPITTVKIKVRPDPAARFAK